MTDPHLYKLIGKQFTLGKLPVVYTIHDVTLTSVHVKSNVSESIQTMELEVFSAAHMNGSFSYIGEPVSIVEEPVEEEEPANYFSLDDL
jgi:hypothetical protein